MCGRRRYYRQMSCTTAIGFSPSNNKAINYRVNGVRLMAKLSNTHCVRYSVFVNAITIYSQSSKLYIRRYEDEFSSPSLRSPKFVNSPESLSFRGVWTYPYFSCALRRYVVSYSVPIVPVQARKE